MSFEPPARDSRTERKKEIWLPHQGIFQHLQADHWARPEAEQKSWPWPAIHSMRVISFNINGLAPISGTLDQTKAKKIRQFCIETKADVYLLQETHIKVWSWEIIQFWKQANLNSVGWRTHSNKKGVAVLSPHPIKLISTDNDGR